MKKLDRLDFIGQDLSTKFENPVNPQKLDK